MKDIIKKIEDNYNWWDKFIMNSKMNWLRWLIYNLPDVPMDTYRNIKWFIQRGKRGYSDCDVWGFNEYLTEVIIRGLMDLKQQAHGCPSEFPHVQAVITEDNDSAMKEWKRILETMIWTFKANSKIHDTKWIPVFNERKRDRFEKFVKNEKFNYYLMTKKDMKRYEEGWKNFKKYYFDLWD